MRVAPRHRLQIFIGAACADLGLNVAVGPATYILDAEHIDFDLNAHAANQIVFDHADAQLTLRNSAAADKTITLQHDLGRVIN